MNYEREKEINKLINSRLEGKKRWINKSVDWKYICTEGSIGNNEI